MTDEKDGANFKTVREGPQNPPEPNHDIQPDQYKLHNVAFTPLDECVLLSKSLVFASYDNVIVSIQR